MGFRPLGLVMKDGAHISGPFSSAVGRLGLRQFQVPLPQQIGSLRLTGPPVAVQSARDRQAACGVGAVEGYHHLEELAGQRCHLVLARPPHRAHRPD